MNEATTGPFANLEPNGAPSPSFLGGDSECREREIRSGVPDPQAPAIAPGELVIGLFLGFGASGELFVSQPLRKQGVPGVARSLVPLTLSDIGRNVVLGFERGDIERPLIVGTLWNPPATPGTLNQTHDPKPIAAKLTEPPEPPDAEELVLTAGKQIVLRCGEASLTLTDAGKVLIQGTYVSSRSTGAQRIKGASVQIN